VQEQFSLSLQAFLLGLHRVAEFHYGALDLSLLGLFLPSAEQERIAPSEIGPLASQIGLVFERMGNNPSELESHELPCLLAIDEAVLVCIAKSEKGLVFFDPRAQQRLELTHKTLGERRA